MPSTSLPPYITSGASSRAHHALLVRLNDAVSELEEDEVISKEIRKAREVLSVQGQSTSKIAETLIILLHCTISRHKDGDDISFAMISAIQLAEGGRTIQERRIGYLYLVERLPRDHELNLLLINTIRKDLSSTIPSHILLALHTISKLPSFDLGPAVLPLLMSKTLLRHKEPAIRQRTVEALISLHRFSSHAGLVPFPLSMNKLLKSMGSETDLSVLSVLLRALRHVIEVGSHRIESEDEREFILERVLGAITNNGMASRGQAAIEVVRTVKDILAFTNPQSTVSPGSAISVWVLNQLQVLTTGKRWEGAFLLEACHLVSPIPEVSSRCLQHIRRLLSPKRSDPSSSVRVQALPAPNDHVLALRCLMTLPTTHWDGPLGEDEMAVVMEGVNSADDTIRRITIRLLGRLSPELPRMILDGYLGSLRESSNLSLPLLLAVNLTLEEKTKIGRFETASRGLEVVEVRCKEQDGVEYARGVLAVLKALGSDEKVVWEEGVARITRGVRENPPSYSEQFAAMFIETLRSESAPIGNTSLAILCTAAYEYLPPLHASEANAIDLLSRSYSQASLSVQELILVALVYLLAGVQGSEKISCCQSVLKTLGSEQSPSKYLQKRCNETITLIEHDLLHEVRATAKSPTLSDVANAISGVITRHSSFKTQSGTGSKASPKVTSSRGLLTGSSMAASQLRYDAYDEPPLYTSSTKGKRGYRDVGWKEEDDTDTES